MVCAAKSIRTMRQSGFLCDASRFFLFLPEPLYNMVPVAENLLGGVPLGGQFAVLFRRSN